MKISESPPIRDLVHKHIQIKAYRISCNHLKRCIVQGRLLGVEEKLYKMFVLLVVRGVVHSWQRVVCQVVYKVLVLGVSKSGKENLKRIAWGLDVGHKDQTRINHLCLRLLSFSVIYFLYLQVRLFV